MKDIKDASEEFGQKEKPKVRNTYKEFPFKKIEVEDRENLHLKKAEERVKKKAEDLVKSFEDKMATSDCNFQRHQAIDCAKLVVDEMLCEYNSLSEDLINMYYKMEKIVIWKNIKKELDCMQ